MSDGTQSKSSTEVVLITCFLLICFEMFQNNHESALSHMSSGLYLFFNWQSTSAFMRLGNRPGEVARQLELIFGRLMLQTILFVDTKPQQWKFITPAFTPALPVIPLAFRSIDEARDCLNSCTCSLYHQMLTSQFQALMAPHSDALSTGDSSRAGTTPLIEWSASFASFLKSRDRVILVAEQQAAAVLQLQYTTAVILATAATSGGEMAFDRFEDEFQNVVNGASHILATNSPDGGYSLPAFDMGILPHLYFVASRCRHRLIRRQALYLLRHGPRQEGIWHREMLTNIAERLIRIEELGPDERTYVPAGARLSVINATINSAERQVTLHCCRQQLGAEKLDIMHEVVEY